MDHQEPLRSGDRYDGSSGEGDADQRDRAADERDRAADQRDRAADQRDRAADQRDRAAGQRDRAGAQRDQLADRRDEAAAERDKAQREFEASMSERLPADVLASLALLRREAAAERQRASEDRRAGADERTAAKHDRERAAADREAGAAERHQAAADRRAWAEDLKNASVDSLTGAYSRAAGFRELQRELVRARRAGQPLTLAFLDVDRLKIVNDTRGHAAGDRMLLDVVHALRRKLRSSDVIMRYGGDEFVCVLPGATVSIAEQRLAAVNTALAEATQGGSVTVGIAQMTPTDSPEDLVARADAALYAERRKRFPLMRQPTT